MSVCVQATPTGRLHSISAIERDDVDGKLACVVN